MPNWPIRFSASAFLSPSLASLSRKALVPDDAMVPSALTRSCSVMPMPLSATVSRFLSLSMLTVIANGAPSATSSGVPIAS